MENLTEVLKSVYEAKDIDDKKQLVLRLIHESSAKVKTKSAAIQAVKRMSKVTDLDKFATNYTLSGEGMKVF